jgi:hypothetical protein
VRRLAQGLALTTLAAALQANAGETAWLGGGGDWFDGTRWSQGVPGPDDVAWLGPNTQTVTLNADTSIGGLGQEGGTLSGSASLLVSGASAWRLGYQDGPGRTTFSGPLELEGAGGKTMTGGRTVEMHDTRWSGNTTRNSGAIWLGGGSQVRNLGVFVEAQNADHLLTGSGGAFDNLGHFSKTSATLTDVTGGIAFHNRGSVDVQAGRLVLSGGGNHSGSFEVAAGALLDLNFGNHVLTDVTVAGAGTLRLSSGTMTIDGTGGRYTTPFVQGGGTVTGGNVVFEGPSTWLTGRQSGSGATVFADTLEMTGPNSKIVEKGRTVSAAQTTWDGAALQLLGSGARFVNAGQLRDLNAGFVEINGGGLFSNAGVYRKQGSGTTRVSGVTLDNPGTLSVEAGTMIIDSPFVNVGALGVAAGASFQMWHPDSVNLGSIFGTGTLRGASGGSFVSRGVISPGMSTGTLTIDGRAELTADSVLEIELAALDDFDRLLGTGGMLLGGELALHALGYAPVIGDSFVIMSFDERLADSTFAQLTSHGFGPGVAFELLYGAQDVTLRVAAVPEPATALAWLAGLAAVGGAVRGRGRARRRA